MNNTKIQADFKLHANLHFLKIEKKNKIKMKVAFSVKHNGEIPVGAYHKKISNHLIYAKRI